MNRAKDDERDHEYMYKFRTNLCTRKRCKNPSRCFNAHSQVMKRRVPKQDIYGRFNYIPEHCPQWKQMKKCTIGESCPRAHGWLEVIFHPLLYKTKMCRSYFRKGVCHEYGVYCAKAHNPTEIRNLVKMYGDGWKSHYDLSNYEKSPISLGIQKSKKKYFKNTLPLKMQSHDHKLYNFQLNQPNSTITKLHSHQKNGRNGARTDPNLKSTAAVIKDKSSSLLFWSPPLFGNYGSICHRMSDLLLDAEVTSYVDLYRRHEETSPADSELKYKSDSHVSKLPSEKTLCATGKTVSSLDSLSTTSSNAKVRSSSLKLQEMRDNSCSDGSCMDSKKTEQVKNNQLQSGHQYISQSLFARPNYEANQK